MRNTAHSPLLESEMQIPNVRLSESSRLRHASSRQADQRQPRLPDMSKRRADGSLGVLKVLQLTSGTPLL
jgi:hypothetical protein